LEFKVREKPRRKMESVTIEATVPDELKEEMQAEKAMVADDSDNEGAKISLRRRTRRMRGDIFTPSFNCEKAVIGKRPRRAWLNSRILLEAAQFQAGGMRAAPQSCTFR
jgi:hypothetical protein